MTEDERMWGRFYNKEEEEARIWAGIRKEERAEAKEELRDEVKAEVKAEVRAEVRNEVRNEIRNEVKNEVRNEVKAEVRAEALEEGINKKTKDVVINMYKQKVDINLISSYVNIKKEEVEKIIQDYLSLNKKD